MITIGRALCHDPQQLLLKGAEGNFPEAASRCPNCERVRPAHTPQVDLTRLHPVCSVTIFGGIQVKSSSGATRPRGDHPGPQLFLAPPSLTRAMAMHLIGVGRIGVTSARQAANWNYGQ